MRGKIQRRAKVRENKNAKMLGINYRRARERVVKLTLALLVLRVLADNQNLAFSLDYLALVAHFLY